MSAPLDRSVEPPFDPHAQLVAHRGNAAEFPENTLPALRSALELGLSHVEFDVQLSADLVPVLSHDPNLHRCAGVDLDVLDTPWAQLSKLSVHDPQRFGALHRGTLLPSLAQVVQLLGQHPGATAFVELKRASLRRHGAQLVLQQVYTQLRPIARQVVIISFDLAAVKLARQQPLRVGWVLPEYSMLTAIKAEATLPDYLFCNHDKLPGDGARLWRGPWCWALYEVSERAQAAALRTRGAHLLETMQVRKLLRELQPAP